MQKVSEGRSNINLHFSKTLAQGLLGILGLIIFCSQEFQLNTLRCTSYSTFSITFSATSYPKLFIGRIISGGGGTLFLDLCQSSCEDLSLVPFKTRTLSLIAKNVF